MNRVRADLAFPPVFGPDNAPNTFRYNGIPPEGTATEPGLRVESALTESNDDIVGSSGNDLIRSYGGVDIVAGGDGDDVIRALPPDSPPSTTLSGGNGNDEIDANGATAATISGGDGDDVLTDAGTLLGEGGADTMTNHGDFGGFVGDLLDGGAGDDALVELPDSTDCPFTVADTNIGGPGRDTVYDDCGVQDVFKLKDGESDKWHCGDFTGIAELDRSDVLVAPEGRLCPWTGSPDQVPEDQEGHREVQAGQRQQGRRDRVQARQEEVQAMPGAGEVQEPEGRQARFQGPCGRRQPDRQGAEVPVEGEVEAPNRRDRAAGRCRGRSRACRAHKRRRRRTPGAEPRAPFAPRSARDRRSSS